MYRQSDIMRKGLIVVLVLVVIEMISLIIGAFTDLGYFESFRVVFGIVFVLFLPGFIWGFVFFPSRSGGFVSERQVDFIERIALSFALSIAIVPLVVFYLNLVGLPISALSSFFVVLLIVGVGLGIILFKKRRNLGRFASY